MVNRVILAGFVGKDPETKKLESGNQFSRFSLATSESFVKKDGEKETVTTWHNIVCWGGLSSKLVEPHVKKGTSLYIEGKISHQQYEKDGQKVTFTEIIASQMNFLQSKREDFKPEPQEQNNMTYKEPDLPF